MFLSAWSWRFHPCVQSCWPRGGGKLSIIIVMTSRLGRKRDATKTKEQQTAVHRSIAFLLYWLKFQTVFFRNLRNIHGRRETAGNWRVFSNKPSKQTEIPLQFPSPPSGIAHNEEHDDIHEPVTKCNLPTRMPQVIFWRFLTRQTRLWVVKLYAAISDIRIYIYIHILYIQIDDIYILYEGWIETPNWCATFGDRIVLSIPIIHFRDLYCLLFEWCLYNKKGLNMRLDSLYRDKTPIFTIFTVQRSVASDSVGKLQRRWELRSTH